MRAHKYSDVDPLRDPDTGKIDPAELGRRVKGWLAVALAFVVLFGGLGFAGLKGYEAYQTFKTAKDYPGPGQAEAQVTIPKNLTTLQIGKLLQEAGVVKDATKFQETASSRPDLWGKVQAGKYRLQTQIPSLTALQQLTDATRAIRVWLTLKEGWRLDPQIVGEMAKMTKLDANAIRAYLKSTTPAGYGVPAWCTNAKATPGEGFLFPDTYEVPDGVKADTMVKKATAQFKAITDKLDFHTAAQQLDFGNAADTADAKACKAVIVASIIDREVFRDEDRAKVARVIYNRLKADMPLELDSTVAYAVGKTSTIWTTAQDRKSRSPYNTYVNKGLPPGPISSPGEAALIAALNPEDGDWLYFVPIDLDTGETVFSKDKAEHDAAVAKLQAWCNASEANKKKCS